MTRSVTASITRKSQAVGAMQRRLLLLLVLVLRVVLCVVLQWLSPCGPGLVGVSVGSKERSLNLETPLPLKVAQVASSVRRKPRFSVPRHFQAAQ